MPMGSNLLSRGWAYPSVSTRFLRLQQSPPHHIQVREGRAHLQSVQILGKPAVAGFAEAKDPLDHSDRMLNLGAHLRLGLVLRPLGLIEPASAMIFSVREVLRSRRPSVNCRSLSLVALISPDSRLSPMQQVRQRCTEPTQIFNRRAA